MITMNRVKTWFCGYVSNSRTKPSRNLEFHIEFLNQKGNPRWFRANNLRNCDHNPQLTTPHDSFVSRVKAPLREECPRGESAAMEHLQVGFSSFQLRSNPRVNSLNQVLNCNEVYLMIGSKVLICGGK